MTCKIARRLIPLFVGGDLPGWLAVRLSGHLDRCEACAAERRALEASQRLARRAASVAPSLPVDFAAQVRGEVVRASQARKMRESAQWTPFRGRPAVVWATAAVLLIAGVGLLNGYLRLQPKEAPGSVAEKSEAAPPEEAVTSDILKEESPEVAAARLAGLMSRLNPRRDLTDEELDAKYPVVESVSRPQGTAMVYHTRDPRITVVWILEPVAAGKGDGVQ